MQVAPGKSSIEEVDETAQPTPTPTFPRITQVVLYLEATEDTEKTVNELMNSINSRPNVHKDEHFVPTRTFVHQTVADGEQGPYFCYSVPVGLGFHYAQIGAVLKGKKTVLNAENAK